MCEIHKGDSSGLKYKANFDAQNVDKIRLTSLIRITDLRHKYVSLSNELGNNIFMPKAITSKQYNWSSLNSLYKQIFFTG